jgi:hypothetical protein
MAELKSRIDLPRLSPPRIAKEKATRALIYTSERSERVQAQRQQSPHPGRAPHARKVSNWRMGDQDDTQWRRESS